MSLADAQKLQKKAEKAMTKGFFSSANPEKALGLYEEAYKIVKRVDDSPEVVNLRIELLEKQAVCQAELTSFYKAGRHLEDAARIVQKRDGEGAKSVIQTLEQSANYYTDAGQGQKACSTLMRACKQVQDTDLDEAEKLISRVMVICEEEKVPSCKDYLDPAIGILVRGGRIEKALEVIRHETRILDSRNLYNRLRYRNYTSEVILLLSRKEKEKAREVLHKKSGDSDFLQSDSYAFASKLLMLFDAVDVEGLKALQSGGNYWLLIHSSVVKIGKKMNMDNMEPGSGKGVTGNDDEVKAEVSDDFR